MSIVGLTVLALVLSGCGADSGSSSTTEATTQPDAVTTTVATTKSAANTTTVATTTSTPPTTTSPEGFGVVAYFLLDELEADAGGPFLVPVYREAPAGSEPHVAAIEALLSGPTADESAGTPSISTAIPPSTSLLGVEVEGSLAKVDLSGDFDDGGGSASMLARLAQVAFTLTRTDSVTEVEFLLEGETVTVFSSEGIELDGPQERSDFYDLLPPIFVDRPAWGEPVTSPVTIGGLSNVFEAVSQVMLTDDDGLPLFEDTVMATCGTGCWGEWETEATFSVPRDQLGSVIVWEFSARDGSRVNIREYPVQLR